MFDAVTVEPRTVAEIVTSIRKTPAHLTAKQRLADHRADRQSLESKWGERAREIREDGSIGDAAKIVLLDELEAEKSRNLETICGCYLDVVREREPYLKELTDALYGPRTNAVSAAIGAARELVAALAIINQANDAIRLEGGVAPSVRVPVDPKALADELKWVCARVGRRPPSINNKRE